MNIKMINGNLAVCTIPVKNKFEKARKRIFVVKAENTFQVKYAITVILDSIKNMTKEEYLSLIESHKGLYKTLFPSA